MGLLCYYRHVSLEGLFGLSPITHKVRNRLKAQKVAPEIWGWKELQSNEHVGYALFETMPIYSLPLSHSSKLTSTLLVSTLALLPPMLLGQSQQYSHDMLYRLPTGSASR